MTRRFAFVTFCLTGVPFAAAQVPAELAPGDATAFVGWRGTAEPGPAYGGSKWEAILKDSKPSTLFDETLPAIGDALARRFPQNGPLVQAVVPVLRGAVRHPGALFLAFQGEQPYGGFVCRASDAKEMTPLLQMLAGQLPPELSAKVVTQEGAVALTVGNAPAQWPAEHLDHTGPYLDGLKAGVADPFYVTFVNVKAAVALGEAAVTKDPDAGSEAAGIFHKFLDASGINGLTAFTQAGGFDGGDWRIDTFLAAPAPRRGLADAMTPAPVDAGLAARVPASANNVAAFSFDAHQWLQTLKTIAGDTDPRALDGLNKGLGAATLAVGKNVEDDLLASFGPRWTAYTSPEIGGTSVNGVVLVNKLTSPLRAKQAMAAVSIAVTNLTRAFVPKQTLSLAGQATRTGNVTVYSVTTPVASPAWAVSDGYLYFGMSPQTVLAAAQFAGPAKADETAETAAALKLPNGVAVSSVSVTDPKPTLDEGYNAALAGGRLVLQFSGAAPTPDLVVPTLAAFAKNTGLVRTATWSDDAGWHDRSVSPYPGAGALANSSAVAGSVGSTALAAGILLPSLNRAREAANRVKSASNLRQIGLAALMYGNEHHGQWPDNVGQLFDAADLTADVFVDPRGDENGPPPPPAGTDKEAAAAWATDRKDYVYVGAGRAADKTAPGVIIAYENPKGLADGINVLFADGHVEFVPYTQLSRTFKAGDTAEPQR